MADAAEVAIESALQNSAVAFAAAQSPAVTINLPNTTFVTPTYGTNVRWLRATFLPATSFELGIGFSSTIQHYGILQVDVFYGQSAGELAPGRVASAIMAWFKRGTSVTKDGFVAKVVKQPYRGTMLKDDPWMMIPVSIPYIAFASPPA